MKSPKADIVAQYLQTVEILGLTWIVKTMMQRIENLEGWKTVFRAELRSLRETRTSSETRHGG